MTHHAGAKSLTPARERILDAAVLWFSQHSYESTGLRDIATLAKVDVAYVHRSFGSKKKLFAEALRAHLRMSELIETLHSSDDLISTLSSFIFYHDDKQERGEISAFDILNQSVCSTEARDVLRDFITGEVVPLLADRMNVENPARTAALILAYTMGMGMFRDVLRLEPLRDCSNDWLETRSRKIIGLILNDTE